VTFHPPSSRYKYCSSDCYHASQRGRKRGPYVERTVKVCKACGREFVVGGERNPPRGQVFCSLACAGKPLAPPPREMSEIERAWLAGLFDGEGSIVSPKGDGVKYSLRITITNTCRELLEEVERVVGTGRIINHRPATERWRQTWYWQCYSDNARDVLRQIRPWLIAKRARASEALDD
jgi:hypothetical protein